MLARDGTLASGNDDGKDSVDHLPKSKLGERNGSGGVVERTARSI